MRQSATQKLADNSSTKFVFLNKKISSNFCEGEKSHANKKFQFGFIMSQKVNQSPLSKRSTFFLPPATRMFWPTRLRGWGGEQKSRAQKKFGAKGSEKVDIFLPLHKKKTGLRCQSFSIHKTGYFLLTSIILRVNSWYPKQVCQKKLVNFICRLCLCWPQRYCFKLCLGHKVEGAICFM